MTSTESQLDQPFAATGGIDPSWRRLSPRMLLVHPVQEIPRALPAVFGIFLAGSTSGHDWWGLASLGVVIAAGMLRWFTTTYRITPDFVQVRRGLVRRRDLSVPRDRVRTVDVTAHALHRLMGLTRVTVGTGRSDRKDDGVRLDGLSAAEAARLREELLHRRAQPAARAATTTDESEIVRLDPKWVRYGPFTLSGFVTAGVIVAFGSRLINETHIDPTRYGPLRAVLDHLTHVPLGLAILQVALAGLIFVAVASTFGYVLAFWGFRLTRHRAGTLHVARGLITSRATTLEERRLRGVELSEPLLLRLAGGARLIAIATGLRVGRGAERGGSLLFPPGPRAEADRVASEVLHDGVPVTTSLVSHGPRAGRRRFTRALGTTAVLVALAGAADWLVEGPPWAWQLALVLLPVAALLAADRYRSLGHALVGDNLVTRQGSLVRRRSMLATDGIVGWTLHRSFFQRRAGLATLTATTAAGRQHYEVLDTELGTAIRLADDATPGLLTPFLVPARSPQEG